MSVLSQGIAPTNPIPVAPDQLPPPKEQLQLLPPTSGPRHEFVIPPNLEGQAPDLRPGPTPGLLPPGSAPSHLPPLHQTPIRHPVQAQLHLFLLQLLLCPGSHRGTGAVGPLRRRVECRKGNI
ncbi:hypothetical protein N1851_021390 [Merluccius polli]|uniref:Uncharacterized protein n=1 Tax=Merluccius polli TaxID=89951 RepID=A0AA47MK01_MERPO|nr:hypothetical protein N1851_021390 [Merluccius polli]